MTDNLGKINQLKKAIDSLYIFTESLNTLANFGIAVDEANLMRSYMKEAKEKLKKLEKR